MRVNYKKSSITVDECNGRLDVVIISNNCDYTINCYVVITVNNNTDIHNLQY